MLGPALIELGTIRIRELEGTVALGIGKTLPQGHRKFNARWPQFEQRVAAF